MTQGWFGVKCDPNHVQRPPVHITEDAICREIQLFGEIGPLGGWDWVVSVVRITFPAQREEVFYRELQIKADLSNKPFVLVGLPLFTKTGRQ